RHCGAARNAQHLLGRRDGGEYRQWFRCGAGSHPDQSCRDRAGELMANRDLTSGRARRAIKMGELASQVGTSYLWTSLRRPFLNASARDKELLETHIRNAQRIVEGSAELRGAFLKLIQMLSMRHDLLPDEALDVLKATQSSVPPMSYAMIAE